MSEHAFKQAVQAWLILICLVLACAASFMMWGVWPAVLCFSVFYGFICVVAHYRDGS